MREHGRFETEIGRLLDREGPKVVAWRFRVLDAAERPLAGARYALHQGSTTDEGVLDAAGEASATRIDPALGFVLHVQGRVCAIVEGAVLLAGEAGVEYGGQVVDWRLADDAKADTAFWPQYAKERARAKEGPLTFLQHDHVMRRPVRLRKGHVSGKKTAVFQASPLRVRVGPLVRFVDERRALVWCELETPGLVRVRYRKADDQVRVPRPGKALSELALATSYSTTVRVGGRHFALVKLDDLAPDTVYQYTLDLAPQPATGALPRIQSQFTDAVFPAALPKDVEAAQAKQLTGLSFRGDRWLFLRTLQKDYEKLRFAHGSCRKWPGDKGADGSTPGPDMLGTFGAEWMAKQQVLSEWPRFFIHTGDQIYADDIGVKQGAHILAQRSGSVVPGPKSPGGLTSGAWAGRFGDRYVAQDPKQPMGARQRIKNSLLWKIPLDKASAPEVTLVGLRRSAKDATVYPSAGETNAVHAADFAEYAYVHQMAWTTEYARKVLAHLPSFMIFDDHEITDDWNFNAKWVGIVHDSKDLYQMWPSTITDGLVAYWMYQGWGNVSPDLWGSDPRVQILDRARAGGHDALPELRKLIFERATRPARPGTPASQRLTWHYRIPVRSPQFLVVDDRSEREVYGPGGPFQDQLAWLKKQLDDAPSPVAFVIFATPFLMPHPISYALTHQTFTRNLSFISDLVTSGKWNWTTIESLARGSDMEHAAGNHVWDELKTMLEKIQDSVSKLKTIAFVSGDIHFSCNLDAQLTKPDAVPPHLLQLVSSGLRQSISETKQKQLKRAYSLFGFTVTGGHRGMKVRLAGLDGDKKDDPNFLFRTSVALVDVDVRDNPGDKRLTGDELPNVAIRQQHLTWNAASKKIETYDFSYRNNEATGPKLLTAGRT